MRIVPGVDVLLMGRNLLGTGLLFDHVVNGGRAAHDRIVVLEKGHAVCDLQADQDTLKRLQAHFGT